MDVLVYLGSFGPGIRFSGRHRFMWALKSGQFDDPEGDASRILRNDDRPLPYILDFMVFIESR